MPTQKKDKHPSPRIFYTEVQLAAFADGNYEIVEERIEIRVHGTTVTRTPTYMVKRVTSDA